MEGLYYPCSENKGADQLRGYREADLRLCFRICKKRFSHNEAHILLERIISDTQEDHKVSVSVGGRILIDFHFADSMVVNDEEKEEADDIVTSMETGDETKIMTNNISKWLSERSR